MIVKIKYMLKCFTARFFESSITTDHHNRTGYKLRILNILGFRHFGADRSDWLIHKFRPIKSDRLNH